MEILKALVPLVLIVAIIVLVILFVKKWSNTSRTYDGDTGKAEEVQKEALNALAEWSKWIIGLQSGFIGLVTLSINDDKTLLQMEAFSWIKLAIVAFVVSIAAATVLLGAIPDALRCRPIKAEKTGDRYDFYKHPTILLQLPLDVVAAVEQIFFLLGVLCFLLAIFLFNVSTEGLLNSESTTGAQVNIINITRPVGERIKELRNGQVTFEFNEDKLTLSGEEMIKEISKEINKDLSISILLGCHTDTVGTEKYNDWLAEGRCKQVIRALEDFNISKERIKFRVLGERALKVLTPDETKEPLNRVVTIELELKE